MKAWDRLEEMWRNRSRNNEYMHVLSCWVAVKVDDVFEIYHRYDTRFKRKVKRTRKDYGLAARVFRDGSYEFFAPLSRQYSYVMPSDNYLLNYISGGRHVMYRARSIRHDTWMRFGLNVYSLPEWKQTHERARALYRERDRLFAQMRRNGVQYDAIYSHPDYTAFSPKLDAIHEEQKPIYERAKASFIPAWSVRYDALTSTLQAIGRPVLTRQWTEKRKDYMERRKQWLSNIKLRAGVNALKVGSVKNPIDWRHLRKRTDQILVTGSPTEQQDVQALVEAACNHEYSTWTIEKGLDSEQIIKAGEKTVKQKAELLRRALKAVVYS